MARTSKLESLSSRDYLLTDPEELVHIDWLGELGGGASPPGGREEGSGGGQEGRSSSFAEGKGQSRCSALEAGWEGKLLPSPKRPLS